jgi:hypothetical protein
MLSLLKQDHGANIEPAYAGRQGTRNAEYRTSVLRDSKFLVQYFVTGICTERSRSVMASSLCHSLVQYNFSEPDRLNGDLPNGRQVWGD